MATILTYLLLAMVTWSGAPAPNEAARWKQIAADAYAASVEEPVYEGPDGAVRTAVLLLAIASYESGGYRRDVDEGRARGDHGRAVCLGQVHVPKTIRDDVATDRAQCFRAMIAKIRTSFASCKTLSRLDRLSGYTTGRCVPSSSSRARMHRAELWWRQNKVQPYYAMQP